MQQASLNLSSFLETSHFARFTPSTTLGIRNLITENNLSVQQFSRHDPSKAVHLQKHTMDPHQTFFASMSPAMQTEYLKTLPPFVKFILLNNDTDDLVRRHIYCNMSPAQQDMYLSTSPEDRKMRIIYYSLDSGSHARVFEFLTVQDKIVYLGEVDNLLKEGLIKLVRGHADMHIILHSVAPDQKGEFVRRVGDRVRYDLLESKYGEEKGLDEGFALVFSIMSEEEQKRYLEQGNNVLKWYHLDKVHNAKTLVDVLLKIPEEERKNLLNGCVCKEGEKSRLMAELEKYIPHH